MNATYDVSSEQQITKKNSNNDSNKHSEAIVGQHSTEKPPANDSYKHGKATVARGILKRKLDIADAADCDMTDYPKVKRLRMDNSEHILTTCTINDMPKGIIWSNNSCGYDAIFVILYHIWTENKHSWSNIWKGYQNPSFQNVVEGFEKMDRDGVSFEYVRDEFRYYMQHTDNVLFKFGQYISLHDVLDLLCSTDTVIRITYLECPNKHKRFQHSSTSMMWTADTRQYTSIADWLTSVQSGSIEHQICSSCDLPITIKCRIRKIPEMFVFEFSRHDSLKIEPQFTIKVHNEVHTFVLKGIIYFGNHHFTSRVFTLSNNIWFHDGMTLGRDMRHEGIHTPNGLDLYYSGNNHASCAIYVKVYVSCSYMFEE